MLCCLDTRLSGILFMPNRGYVRFAYRFDYRQLLHLGLVQCYLSLQFCLVYQLEDTIYIGLARKYVELLVLMSQCLEPRFVFPALGGLLFGYDIGATSGATISVHVSPNLIVPLFPIVDVRPHMVSSSFFSLLSSVAPPGSTSLLCS